MATLQAVSAASVHGVHRHRGLHVEVENTTLSVDTEGTFGVDAEVDVNDNTPSSSYWLETIEKRGVATFNNASSTYKVFRNVRDYGAKGILLSLSPVSQNRLLIQNKQVMESLMTQMPSTLPSRKVPAAWAEPATPRPSLPL